MKKRNLKRIIKFLEDIEWMFELNNWDRTLTEVLVQPDEYPTLTAEVIPDMTYKDITIKLYPNFFTISLENQRKALLHELVHVVIQDTKMIADDLLHGKFHSQTEIKDANEKAVSTITYYLDYLLTGNLKYAKRAYKDYLKK